LNNLKKYRKECGLTQIELAVKVNVSSDYISMIEREVRSPGLKLARLISKNVGGTLDEVFPSDKLDSK